MKPPLVALDFQTLTARRYWPKPDGGFIVDEAMLVPSDQQDERMAASIEDFRVTAGRERHVNVRENAS